VPRYLVLVQKNGTEKIEMIATADGWQLARDVAINELRLEDPDATYEIIAHALTRRQR